MLQYEIEHKGKKYFGNVTLKEIHPFEYGGEFYLLDVDGMVPHKIPESKYIGIARVSSYPNSLIPEARMQDLFESYRVEGLNEYYRAVVCSLPGCQFYWARYSCGGGKPLSCNCLRVKTR